MHIVLDGFSALDYWLSDLVPEHPIYLEGQPPLSSFDSLSCGQITEMMRRTGGSCEPLELLVFTKRERRHSAYVTCHAWGSATLPPKSICEIGDGVYTISPELCLVRLASRVSRLELLRHATDLLGIFSRSYMNRTDLVERRPVMTKESLAEYISHAGHISGTKILRRVLPWLRAHSASPRETSMLLMLTLPTRVGGMGISRFAANVAIPLSEEALLLTQKSYLVGDAVYLYDKENESDEDKFGPILEYNSSTNHDTEEQLEFDFEKITALQRMGLTVIPVSTRQFNSFASFEQIVERVRELIGQREKPQRGRRGAINIRRSVTHSELLALERQQRESTSLVNTARWLFLLPWLHDWRDSSSF